MDREKVCIAIALEAVKPDAKAEDIADMIEQAMKAEIEICAHIADKYVKDFPYDPQECAYDIAEEIRARL